MMSFRRRLLPRVASLAAAILVSGCLESQAFRPAEQATARSTEGHPAAEYHLRGAEGAEVGEVKVWSRGAEETKQDGERVTSVHVGFELENESDGTMTFYAGQLRLAYTTSDGETVEGIAIRRAGGDREVGSARTRRIDAYFAIDADPSDLDVFRVSWALDIAGTRYVEQTPFIRALRGPSGYPPYYYPPYYDPFYPRTFGYPVYVVPVHGGPARSAPARVPNRSARPRR